MKKRVLFYKRGSMTQDQVEKAEKNGLVMIETYQVPSEVERESNLIIDQAELLANDEIDKCESIAQVRTCRSIAQAIRGLKK